MMSESSPSKNELGTTNSRPTILLCPLLVGKPFPSLGDVEDVTKERKTFRPGWKGVLSTPKESCYHEHNKERDRDCRRKQHHRK